MTIDNTALSTPDAHTAVRLGQRWLAIRAFSWIGAICIVAGGLVAAVTLPTGFAMGSWLAAFLVLVGGVAQLGLGIGQGWIATSLPEPDLVRSELTTWNLGAALTIAGSLTKSPVLTTVGSLSVAAALLLFLRGVSVSPPELQRQRLAYRLLVWFVLLSTPVGIALAWIRHG